MASSKKRSYILLRVIEVNLRRLSAYQLHGRRQPLWTRRMAIANGTCVSFCNQPTAHFGLVGFPRYAPGTIVVNVTWMKRRFNACQMHRIMYPSIFNRFSVIQPVSSKVRHFSTLLHILAYPGYAPGTTAVNVTWMERWFNAGQTHRSIYPSIVNRLRAIARCCCCSILPNGRFPSSLTPSWSVLCQHL